MRASAARCWPGIDPASLQMLGYIREGDRLHVTAIDRLGRNAIDIHATVRALNDRGVEIIVRGLGSISSSAGRLIVAVLAEIAEMEREAIRERTEAGEPTPGSCSPPPAGRTAARRASAAAQGGPVEVIAWRITNGASPFRHRQAVRHQRGDVKRYLASTVPPPTPGPPSPWGRRRGRRAAHHHGPCRDPERG